ncbi:MAG: septum formation initiator family protein [Bacteroidales bacterium]|nr:septum formation initiator family protein [Bacteroidales bacterium]
MAQDKKHNKQKRQFALTRWIPDWINIKWVIVILVFLIMIFFGRNSYLNILEYQKTIDELKVEIDKYNDTTQMYRQKAHSLATDRETLERIAREQYGMKREKEDVFITDIP